MAAENSQNPEARFAIYFAPEPDDPWWRFGVGWLGADPATGDRIQAPAVPGISRSMWEQITAGPRFYGWHATLKPPFQLDPGFTEEALITRLSDFARTRAPFALPGLSVQTLSGFLALRLTSPCPEIHQLADSCVKEFDDFRKPESPQESAKRDRAELTDRQRGMLKRWGYPYVLDEFRFHMTLTEKLGDAALPLFASALTRLAGTLPERKVPVTGLCVYYQPDRVTPFRLRWRIRWDGSATRI